MTITAQAQVRSGDQEHYAGWVKYALIIGAPGFFWVIIFALIFGWRPL